MPRLINSARMNVSAQSPGAFAINAVIGLTLSVLKDFCRVVPFFNIFRSRIAPWTTVTVAAKPMVGYFGKNYNVALHTKLR